MQNYLITKFILGMGIPVLSWKESILQKTGMAFNVNLILKNNTSK